MSLTALWAAATTAASPVLRVMLWVRARRGKEIAGRLAERRGLEQTERPRGPLVWLHAASVGETMSVLRLLSALAERCAAATLLLTTGTVTSTRLLALRLPELGLEGRVIHRFAPLDVPAWAGRFLDHWRPDVAGFVESELWPNIIAGCAERAIPMMLINGRLSARSFARWGRIGGAAAGLLGRFARIEAQSQADADRFLALGARAAIVSGNLKFAAAPLPADEAELARLRSLVGSRPVWLAASTHPGEEELIFSAHQRMAATHPSLLTIVAPRHPERGPDIHAIAGACRATRRGAGEDPPDGAGVWIADTLGELGLFYRLAPVAFVGRSLLPPGGGQNPLEAARLGCAVAVGPFTANFADIVVLLSESGALTTIEDAAALVIWADRMLREPAARAAAGQAGTSAAARLGDLPQRTAATLLGLIAAPVGHARS